MESKSNINKFIIYYNKLGFYPSNLGNNMDNNFITLKEWVKEENIKSCLFTTFGYNAELFDLIFKENVKSILVTDHDSAKNEDIFIDNSKFWKFIYPKKKLENYNLVFHPKIILLNCQDYIRIIISSSNMYFLDWILWSNVIFKVDIFKKSDKNKEDMVENSKSDFFTQFTDFLNIFLKNKNNLIADFWDINYEEYNFNIDLPYIVSSYPCLNLNESDKFKAGLFRLREISLKMKVSDDFLPNNTKIYYSSSSLGVIDFRFLYQFAYSIIPNFDKNFKTKEFDEDYKKKITSLFKILYPTQEYVKNSPYKDDINCLFLNKIYYNLHKFEKKVLQKFENTDLIEKNKGIIAHTKFFLILKNNKIEDDSIIYFGSHNFTKQAWGNYKNKMKGFEAKNYELGIILEPKIGSAKYKQDLIKNIGFKVLDSKPYSLDDLPYFSS